jgi:hypothetical protein
MLQGTTHPNMIEHMFDSLIDVEASLQEVIQAFDAEFVEGADAVVLLERFDRLARLAAAGQAMCAARIKQTGAWRRSGHRDAAGFIATRTGSHRSQAKDAISIGTRLTDSAGFAEAVRSGSISPAQAAEIADTLTERPDAEAEVLRAAQTATARELRGVCNEILSRGTGADERHARAQEQRYCSSSVGRDGQWRLNAGLTVLDGALVDKVLEYFQNEAFDDARLAGKREPFTAYRADALVRMAKAAMAGGVDGDRLCDDVVSGAPSDGGTEPQPRRRRRRRPGSRSSSLRHAIIITVPHTLFLNEGGISGETCQIPGVGPVPLVQVHQLLEGDPIIKCIVTRGRDITATATMTRTIKDDLRLAVLHQHDYQCAVPGCTNTRFLELDHRLEFSKDGPTDYRNLRPLCSFHHDQRTQEGYELVGELGDYRWLAPDGTILLAEASATPSMSVHAIPDISDRPPVTEHSPPNHPVPV